MDKKFYSQCESQSRMTGRLAVCDSFATQHRPRTRLLRGALTVLGSMSALLLAAYGCSSEGGTFTTTSGAGGGSTSGGADTTGSGGGDTTTTGDMTTTGAAGSDITTTTT